MMVTCSSGSHEYSHLQFFMQPPKIVCVMLHDIIIIIINMIKLIIAIIIVITNKLCEECTGGHMGL